MIERRSLGYCKSVLVNDVKGALYDDKLGTVLIKYGLSNLYRDKDLAEFAGNLSESVIDDIANIILTARLDLEEAKITVDKEKVVNKNRRKVYNG